MNPKLLKNLKITRVGLGYTYKTLGELINLSPQAYGKIERGDTPITIDRLENIAEVLGVTKQYLEKYDATAEKVIFENTSNDNSTLSLIVTQINETQEK